MRKTVFTPNQQGDKPMPEITLTTAQILNLCEFAGIEINREKSVFYTDADQLETPYCIGQNEHGAIAWLEEYPDEGCYPLSDHDDE
jgi:hypothetical protein